jgi:cell division protein FtsI (penicillin-binding protein 3)
LYLSSFVGYGPASNPRFIMAVTIDEPSAGKIYGGEVSAPVFSNVMAQALRMAGVQPDAPALVDAGRTPANPAGSASVVVSPQQPLTPLVTPFSTTQVAVAPKDRG